MSGPGHGGDGLPRGAPAALRLSVLDAAGDLGETDVLRLAVQQAVAALGGLGGLAHLAGHEHDTLRLAAVSGVPDPVARDWERIDGGDVAPVRAVRERRPQWSQRWPPPAEGRGLPVSADALRSCGLLSAPILVEGFPVGVLSVLVDREPDRAGQRFLADVAALLSVRLPGARRWRTGTAPWWQEPQGVGSEVMRQISVGTWSWDLDSGIVELDEVSDGLVELAGLDPRGWDHRIETWMERIHPDDRPGVQEAIEESLGAGQRYSVEYRVVDAAGRVNWIELRAACEYDETGHAVRMVGTVWNATSRRNQLEWLAGLLELHPDPIHVVAADNRVQWANRAARELSADRRDPATGRTRGLTGRIPWEAEPRLDGLGLPELLDRARAAPGSAATLEVEVDRPDPHDRASYLVRAVEIGGFVSIQMADTTEQNRTERAAAERNQRVMELNTALVRALNTDDVVAAVAQHVPPLVHADGLVVHDLTGPSPRLIGDIGFSPARVEELHALHLRQAAGRFGPAGGAQSGGTPERAARAGRLSRTDGMNLADGAGRADRAAFADRPLFVSGRGPGAPDGQRRAGDHDGPGAPGTTAGSGRPERPGAHEGPDAPGPYGTPGPHGAESGRRGAIDADDGRATRAWPLLGMLAGLDGIGEWAVLPLVVGDRQVGSCVIGWSTPRGFTEDDKSLLGTVGVIIAQALGNARLYETARHRAERLQQELLPGRLPDTVAVRAVARYRTADGQELGGDWYDTIPLPGGRTLAVIGDVMGHGLEQALAMGIIRHAALTVAALDLPVDEIMAHLNDVVVRLAPRIDDPVVCATCILALYDPTTGSCSIASAGHAPPIALGPGENPHSLAIPTGPPLGLAQVPAQITETVLAEGTVLVLYTDGLLGSRAPDPSELTAAVARYAGVAPVPSGGERAEHWLGTLCDAITAELPPDPRRQDDAALLTLSTGRVPEDRMATWDLPWAPESAGRARDVTVAKLAQWELDGDLTDPATLVVSELIGNTVRHAVGLDTEVGGDDDGLDPRLGLGLDPDPDADSGPGSGSGSGAGSVADGLGGPDGLDPAAAGYGGTSGEPDRADAGHIRLRLLHFEHSLICEVYDGSQATPRVRHPLLDDEFGRGLQLVAMMAGQWGTRYTENGKCIWAKLDTRALADRTATPAGADGGRQALGRRATS